MPVNYECCHEELLQNHSLKITELEKEVQFKKEKLDDLKQTQQRMENKIDEINECVNKLMLKSKTEDDKLENRLIAIETEQKTIKEQQNKKLAIIGVILAILTFYFNYIH